MDNEATRVARRQLALDDTLPVLPVLRPEADDEEDRVLCAFWAWKRAELAGDVEGYPEGAAR